jgi:hypothetical protein
MSTRDKVSVKKTQRAGRQQVFVGFSDCLDHQHHDVPFCGKTIPEPGEHSLADGGIGHDRQTGPVLLSCFQRQNYNRFFGVKRPKLAASQFAPEKHASLSSAWAQTQGPCQSGGLVSAPSRGIAFRSGRSVLILENRSLFDVDFKIGDDVLRFARLV